MPKRDFNKFALQLYWHRTSPWVLSCKFAAYFQNTFSYEHFWVVASGSHPEVFWQRKGVFKNFAKFAVKHLFRSLFVNKVAGFKPETFRSSYWRCSVKQGALKNFANFTGNNLCWSLFLIKFHSWVLQIYHRKLRHRRFLPL